MSQNHSVLGQEPKACIRTASDFDAEMDDFGYTAKRRGAFFLEPEQNRSRPVNFLIEFRP